MEDVVNILDNLGEAILVHREGSVLYINQAFSDLVGETDRTTTLDYLSDQENNLFHLIHADDRGLVMHYIEQRNLGNDDIPTVYSFRLVTPLGVERWVECSTGQILWDKIPASMTKYHDVSHRHIQERSDMMLRSLFEDSLNAIPCVISITDAASGKMIYVNKFTLNFFRYTSSEMIGKTASELGIWVNPDDRATIVSKLQAKEPVTDFLAEQRDGEGNVHPMSINATLLQSQPTPLIFITSFDRTEEHNHREKLNEINANLDFLARHDSLTGLFNRREGMESLSKEMARFYRYKEPMAILLMDIDHFKHVNDNFGHEGGDVVLVEVTNRIQKSIREVDVCCRWGGEEFIVIMPSTDYNAAKIIAERIRKMVSISRFKLPHNESVTITISIGCARMSSEISSNETFVKVADDLLYLAKNRGRDQVSYSE